MNLYSEESNSSSKSRLLIYNFTTTDNYEDVKKKDRKDKNYQYYTVVIPETIAKSFKKNGDYEIQRETGPFSIEADFADNKEKKKYIQKLRDLGKQSKSDYIITGTYNVTNKKLKIRLTVFDVKGREIRIIDNESDELGARLLAATDILSQQLNENITGMEKLNQERSNRSPFTALYSPLSIITIGVDSGYLYMMGDWSSVYNDAFYISPFIDFDITEDFSLSMKAASIQSDSDDKETSSYSQIRMLSSTISLSYMFRFTDNAGFAVSAGGGITKSTITMSPGKPFEDSLAEKDSIDPNIDLSSYFVYNLSSFNLRAGVLYKRIFFKDEPMDSGVIFAGAGIHF
jgi:hypothetical protein